MSKKYLIIGKSSNLVGMWQLTYDSISHNEVFDPKYFEIEKNYDYLLVFSWSFKNQEDNLRLLKALDLTKVIFVSTSAIYSLQKRSQVSKYPKMKKDAEAFVINSGGRIVRVGIPKEHISLSNIYGYYPFTDREMFIATVDALTQSQSKILDAFTIKFSNIENIKLKILRAIYSLSVLLPNLWVLQLALQVPGKLLKTRVYGVSADTSSYFFNEIQIGMGLFGSQYHSNREHSSSFCGFYSGNRVTRLNSRGFKNTLVGDNRKGSGAYWHGAYYEKLSENTYKKVVQFFPQRPLSFKSFKQGIVTNVEWQHNHYKLWVLENGKLVNYFCEKLILASGPISNSRLLSKLINREIRLSDHELGIFGQMKNDVAKDSSLIKLTGPFVRRGVSKYYKLSDRMEFILELRPFHDPREGREYYTARTSSIVIKLIRGLSVSRLNEAFFNKFGVGLASKKYNIFVQLLVKGCIRVNGETLNRTRASDEYYEEVKNQIQKIGGTPIDIVNTIDAQHMTGYNLDDLSNDKTINFRNLTIIGAPYLQNNSALHHSYTYIRKLQDCK